MNRDAKGLLTSPGGDHVNGEGDHEGGEDSADCLRQEEQVLDGTQSRGTQKHTDLRTHTHAHRLISVGVGVLGTNPNQR